MTSSQTISKLARIDSGYPFKSKDWLPDGLPVVKIGNVKDGYVTLEGCAFVSQSVADRATDFLASSGDILISLTGYVGQVGRVLQGDQVYVNQRVGLVRPREDSDRAYIYFLLRSLRSEIESLGTGSAQSNVSPRDIERLPIPPLSPGQRRANAGLLEDLEKLIQTNRKLSNNLESIAQTLFRSWFVDFDPVRAKMAGEKPAGMDDATAALFPDSMVDSELGEIPAGWIAGSLSDLTNLQGGCSFKSSSWTDRGVPVVKIGSVKPGFVDLSQVSFVSDELASTVRDIYLLPEGSLVIGLTGYVGEVGLVKKSSPTPLLNQRVAKFVPRDGDWRIPFIYCLVRDAKFKEKVMEMATGSAQQNVSTSQILSIPAVVPDKQIQSHFEQLLDPVFGMILHLAVETETLRRTRDALLPRLISGELEVPESLLVS